MYAIFWWGHDLGGWVIEASRPRLCELRPVLCSLRGAGYDDCSILIREIDPGELPALHAVRAESEEIDGPVFVSPAERQLELF